jgi:Phage capsid family
MLIFEVLSRHRVQLSKGAPSIEFERIDDGMKTVTRPFLPSDSAFEREQHRSLVRVATAKALGLVTRGNAEEILRRTWPGDTIAQMVLKAAVTPTTTTSASSLAVDAVAFLASMAPQSAAVRLFERALRINLAGIDTTNVARLTSVPPGFVAEGAPIPVVAGTAATTPVGPTFKMAFIVVLSNELEFSSPENASSIIARALSDAAMKQLDTVVFDATAGTGSRPSGLLNGLSPITATAGGGPSETVMASDFANLVGALADAGVDAETMVVVTNPRQAVKLRLVAGPAFQYSIFGTAAVASGTVIAIAPSGVASGFDGAPTIEASTETTLHLDTAPVAIGTPGAPATVAAPTRNLLQTDTRALKIRTRCAWSVVHPGAVQYLTGANW